MRIVHLSDIHLSKENYSEFTNNVRESLIIDLINYNTSEKPIDLIIITGDLVDKGGHSLKKIKDFNKIDNPYEIFEKIFIDPISSQIGIPKEKFLFIPGNHDIDENEILWIDEKKLKESIDSSSIGDVLENHRFEFNSSNHRIKLFKEFERKYHIKTPNYIFSNNESTYTYELKNGSKVGFILINDSWRCSSCNLNKPELNHHFFGTNQLYNAFRELKNKAPILTFCLFHHSLEDFHEIKEVKKFLLTKHIPFFLYGHHHNTDSTNLINPIGSSFGFRGRATLNNPNEKEAEYQPGYQLYDINFGLSKIEAIHYRKYENNISQFVADTSFAPKNGIDKNGYKFNQTQSPNKALSALDESNFKME
jgi:predicted MPP superfamily phosphohydrolase